MIIDNVILVIDKASHLRTQVKKCFIGYQLSASYMTNESAQQWNLYSSSYTIC